MFTGIIECEGIVKKIIHSENNLDIIIESDISSQLRVDQSVAHNGICLTVTKVENNTHQITAIAETLKITNLSSLMVGDTMNLERCMPANGRFDGHIVQGHIDTTAICEKIIDEGGSKKIFFSYQGDNNFTVVKGSICVNGISLTVVDSLPNQFSVAIIPYTLHHTNLKEINIGSVVNIEFDILGKYIAKWLDNRKA